MQRWMVIFLLIIGVLMLVGSAAGDAFLVHHHSSGLSIDEHYPTLAVGIICGFILVNQVYNTDLFRLPNRGWSLVCRAIARCFCGWNSSAYVELGRSPELLPEPMTF